MPHVQSDWLREVQPIRIFGERSPPFPIDITSIHAVSPSFELMIFRSERTGTGSIDVTWPKSLLSHLTSIDSSVNVPVNSEDYTRARRALLQHGTHSACLAAELHVEMLRLVEYH